MQISLLSLVIYDLPDPEVRWASITTRQNLMKFILIGSSRWFWWFPSMIRASDPTDLCVWNKTSSFIVSKWMIVIHDAITAIFVYLVLSYKGVQILCSVIVSHCILRVHYIWMGCDLWRNNAKKFFLSYLLTSLRSFDSDIQTEKWN